MKKILKITVSVILLLSVCLALTSCPHVLYRWNPCNQPGTYWESTDSSVSFRIWEENDSDPYYALVMQHQENYGIGNIDYCGRGKITHDGESYDVFVMYDMYGDGIYFETINCLDLRIKAAREENKELISLLSDVDGSNEQHEDSYFMWYLYLNYKRRSRSVGEEKNMGEDPRIPQLKQLYFNREIDLRRIDPS